MEGSSEVKDESAAYSLSTHRHVRLELHPCLGAKRRPLLAAAAYRLILRRQNLLPPLLLELAIVRTRQPKVARHLGVRRTRLGGEREEEAQVRERVLVCWLGGGRRTREGAGKVEDGDGVLRGNNGARGVRTAISETLDGIEDGNVGVGAAETE